MEASRSSTPEAPPQDLWSSILDSVSSSRSIPSKQVLILGQPSSGKSTIAAALLQKPLPEETNESLRSDFALGYDYADVRDDADEDTLARLSVYTVPSVTHSYTALLPHFIPPSTSLPHTVVIITLDWTRPWTFVDELQTALEWVEKWTAGDKSRELQIAREESRERLQAHLQQYTEPTAEPTPAPSTLANTVLPLSPGTLSHNFSGAPIIVACTKSDLIDESVDLAAGTSGMGGMVKGKGDEWEERTDGVMQVLRTICLKYGAALFYTTPLPATLHVLRQYALHLLFVPPAPSPGVLSGAEPAAPIRNPFPFQQKPNTLDRDRVVVPAGWDSWGKIAVMREGFEAKVWGEAWERDIENDDTQVPDGEPGAKKMFSALVPDQGAKPPPQPPLSNPTPEQAFLAKHYDENSKKLDKDPRKVFQNPTDAGGSSTTAGVVGPLQTSSFSLPNVDRALTEMETGIGGAPRDREGGGLNGVAERRAAARTAGGARVLPSALSNVTTGAPNGHSERHPTSGRSVASPAAGSPSPTGGQTQHEVLQKFFASLLTKDRTEGAGGAVPGAPSAKPSPSKTNGGTQESGGS